MAGTATGAKGYMEDMPTDAMCGDLFDHIDDLLDFPNDDDTGFMVMGGMTTETTPYTQVGGGPLPATPLFPPPPLPSPPKVEYDAGLVVCGGGVMPNASSGDDDTGTAAFNQKGDQLFDDLDIADLEWLSNFMDDSADSFSLDFPTADIGSSSSSNGIKEQSLFRTPSPVSVLEPSSHSSGGGASSSSSSFSYSGGNGGGSDNGRALQVPFKSPDPISAVPARARSKRPRPATFFPRPHVTIPFLPPSSDCLSLLPPPPPPSEPESFGESNAPPATNKAKKKKKKNPPAAAGVGRDEAGPPPVRKCMHCEIQKTPQWRAGPMGPKTLCNACGVRYKSGRLFPEYRPAASPTFVPSIHSNSHKKVVEMRINSIETATPGMPSMKSCDLLEYIRRRE